MPSIGNLHVDQALTDVSVMYSNSEYVAEEVFPVLPVEHRSDKYHVLGLEQLRTDDDLREPGGEADEFNWSLSQDSYYCDGHALASPIPDEWRENEDAALDLDTDTTVMLTDRIMARREVNAVTAITAALTPTDLSASGYANAFDTDTADPIKIIDSAKETIQKAIGRKPNRLLLSRPIFRAMRNNLLVKNRISGAQYLDASLITAQMLAAVLEVDKVVVGEAINLTNKEGQTNAGAYIWGKYALLYYLPPAIGKRMISLGMQPTWNKGRLGSLVYRHRVDRKHADVIEVMRYYDLKIVAAGAGQLWSNATQN